MVESAPSIVIDPKVRFGKPTFRGTRVTVAAIAAKVAGGMLAEEIMQEYDLTQAEIRVALFTKNLENKSQKSNHAQTN